MSTENSQDPGSPDSSPVSAFTGPAAVLIAHGLFAPPSHPGILGQVDSYNVLRLLGTGGMGMVFLARDTRDGCEVALKMLRPELVSQPRLVQRFVAEARHLQKLRHPHLLPVKETSERKAGPYFVMPHYAKGSLASLLKSGAPLDPEVIHAVAQQLAEALRFIHSRGLVHRDVKPGNILLDEDNAVRLSDFGLAQTFFNDSLMDVESSHCEGTAPYMSPAVAAGEAEDTRCDIYAFGAVLYEMLTGRPPYEGETTKAVLNQIKSGPPRPILQVKPKAPPGLARIAEWAMAREHRDRYADMSDVLSDLGRVRDGKPPAAAHGMTRVVREKIAWPWPIPKSVWVPALSLAAAALVAWFIWPRSRLEVVGQFTSPQVSDWSEAVPVQWDKDGRAELLVTEGGSLHPFSSTGSRFWKWTCSEPMDGNLLLGMAADADGDGMEEAFVSWTRGKELKAAVINQHPREIRRFAATGRERYPANRWATSMLMPIRLVGPDGVSGGRHRLLAALQTNYGGGDSPRGLCCFDYETQQMLWCDRMGPALERLEVLDLDHDGLLDFLVGSYSPDNSNRGPDGTDDSHSYLFAISSDGKRMWTREMGGVFSLANPVVADLDGDGRREILGWASTPEWEYTNAISSGGRISRLDYAGKEVSSFTASAGLLACTAVDIDGDGKQEVACADYEGYVYLLGADLKLRRKVQVLRRPSDTNALFTLVSPISAQGAKLKRGPAQQLVVTCAGFKRFSYKNPGYTSQPPDSVSYEDLRIVVLGRELRVLTSFKVTEERWQQLSWSVRVADTDGDSLDEIISLSDKVQILKPRSR